MLYKAKLAKTITDERRNHESLVVTDGEYPNLLKWKVQKRLAATPAPGTEAYEPIVENPFLSAYEAPLSTFGVDVDTASYANMRRFLTQQQLPPPNAVRVEELVNYFRYDYPQPAGAEPFSVSVDSGPAPWQPQHKLVRIGLKAKEIPRDQRPASNLVFLVDVSGSMQPENKLPLVKMGLRLLTQQMTESDRVAIVTYSNTAAQRLESTNGANKEAILGVIESLHADGSTNGAAGIQLAYRAALDHFIQGGTNRVILCTDGDFNVGVTGDDELVQLIHERARTKVFFSVFGFGMGNLKDGKLEKLADKGNGHYAYIDSQREAQKMFVDELVGTLVTIAKDVKIQVEFNPNQVGFYRLIGYENRVLAAQDFNDDRKDAGDIGAGHTVTALYEIVPAGEAPRPELGDTLRYRKAVVPQEGALARELLTVKLRFKLPEADASTLIEVPISGDVRDLASESKVAVAEARAAGRDFNWAAAVASFGMLLRDSQFRGQTSFDMILELAQGAKGDDPTGRRQEFIDLVNSARALCVPVAPVPPAAGAPATVLGREEAEAKATVNGKYRNLLRIVEAPADAESYGPFHDYGRWEETSYAGQSNLPQGYWVYVAPNWFIWGDQAK
jgi:Ca-activated chloride channel family protein